jgi:oligoendopeptidase F
MTTAIALPRWDMTPIYPGLDSPEFVAGFAAVREAVATLGAEFDAEGIDQQPQIALDDATVARATHIIGRMNEVLTDASTLESYIRAFIATDSRDPLAQARLSEMEQVSLALSNLLTRFTGWIGSLDVEELIARSPVAADHAHALRQAWISATHLMSPAEENLAAEMDLTGGGAWSKFYGSFTSQIMVPVTLHGVTQDLPMSAVRNLAMEEDRDVRQAGYQAELVAWERHALPLAFALNSIKGQVNALTRRRGWETPLDQSLFAASIDRPTLDAMLTAAYESFPAFRRYLHLKAQALGIERLAFYDLFAPVGGSERPWTFPDAAAFIVAQFAAYSPRLSQFADRAFREQWIDAEPRVGKRGGAFCMWLRNDESRVMANFTPSYNGMRTLAHELGHGYHNLNLATRTILQRRTPMTLAETASIFCETLIRDAALKDATPNEQLQIIEAFTQNTCQVVLDITSRFLFEQRVFERRRERELSIGELCDIMRQAQIETYGDGLDHDQLHPYMWAAKVHYYSTGRSFYNYPYMFGLLFGLGLYARYQQDPDEFRRNYDALLSSTGMADAATLAARFDIDLRAPDFWRASLDVVRADIARFATLVAEQKG